MKENVFSFGFATVFNGVLISVQVFYNTEYSNPKERKHIFVYKIALKNLNPYPVQLLKRHWIIFDSVGIRTEVKGDGVIGKQPVLQTEEVFHYDSWSNISSEIGNMEGSYTFKNIDTETLFEVQIPKFQLIAPTKLN